MENIKSELHKEKQYDWFEDIIKKWNNYELTVDWVKWEFICKNPQDFLNILKITKKILTIYEKNNEDEKFYVSEEYINWIKYEDLVLNNWIIDDTTYLTQNAISKYIWDNNLQEYVKFINSLIKKKFVKNWKNINIQKLDNLLKERYELKIQKVFSKYNITLEKELQKEAFYDIYYKLLKWNNPWILKNFSNEIKSGKIEQSIVSIVVLKVLMRKWYKIKDIQDMRTWSDYSNNMEFHYFKNLLSSDFKVSFFDQNYNPDVRKLKFIKEWDKINIIWKTSNWKQINIWEIQINQFYSNLF